MKIEDFKNEAPTMQLCYKKVERQEPSFMVLTYADNAFFQTSKKKVLPFSKKAMRFK